MRFDKIAFSFNHFRTLQENRHDNMRNVGQMIQTFPGIDNQVFAGITLRTKYQVPNICHHKTSLWMSEGKFNPDFEFWHDIPPFLPPINICKQDLWEYFHVAIHDCGLSHLEFHPIIYRLSACKERQRWYAFLALVSILVDRERPWDLVTGSRF